MYHAGVNARSAGGRTDIAPAGWCGRRLLPLAGEGVAKRRMRVRSVGWTLSDALQRLGVAIGAASRRGKGTARLVPRLTLALIAFLAANSC